MPGLDGSAHFADEPLPNWTDFARALRRLHAGGVILMGDGTAYLAKAIQSGKDGVEPPISLESLGRCAALADLDRRAYGWQTTKLPTLNRIADFAVAAQQWVVYCREEPRAADPKWVRQVFRNIDPTNDKDESVSRVEWVALYPDALVASMRAQVAKDAQKAEKDARLAAAGTNSRVRARVRDV